MSGLYAVGWTVDDPDIEPVEVLFTTEALANEFAEMLETVFDSIPDDSDAPALGTLRVYPVTVHDAITDTVREIAESWGDDS